MSNPQEDTSRIPTFISQNQAASPFFYFRHIVDPEDVTTLRVQVIGPNLEFAFEHSRAKEILSASKIRRQLKQKTAGFVAHVSSSAAANNGDGGVERLVLASAESGHGAGRFGDLLDVTPGVLANAIWTRRVVSVGRLLEVNMRRPFDKCPGITVSDTEGIFQGSHVEVKLAVHGVFALLKTFGIASDFDRIGMRHLLKLRNARWADGSRPALEVYFSRKNCTCCGQIAQALADATGVSIKLLWKHRLELKEYERRSIKVHAGPVRPRRDETEVEVEAVVDDQDVDFGDGMCKGEESDMDTLDSDSDCDSDLRIFDTIDLVSHPAITISPSPNPVPQPEEEQQQQAPPHPADDYLDGLAYRVGQLESSPCGAAEAIVQFATKMVGTANISWEPSTSLCPPSAFQPSGRSNNSSSPSSIAKPLPATPAIEPPAWMLRNKEEPDEATGDAQGVRRRDRSSSESDEWEFPGRKKMKKKKSSVSPSERAAWRGSVTRERSPRVYSSQPCERTYVGERLSRIRVELPARKRV